MNQTPPPFLYGEHELTLDDKNRLSVPAQLRKAIDSDVHGDAFFGLIGVNRRIWLYPDRYYQSRLGEDFAEMTPHDEWVDYNHANFSMADRFTVDKQGRMLLDDKLIRRSGLLKDVTMIGARDHLELWNRSDWEARFQELMGKPGEVARRARQIRRETQGVSEINGETRS